MRILAKSCLLACGTRDTVSIPVRVSAHAEQKRAWPHGTNATRSRGTSRRTSHISVAGDVADVDISTPVWNWCHVRIDVELVISIPGPAFPGPAYSSPAFSVSNYAVLHFHPHIFGHALSGPVFSGPALFQYCIFGRSNLTVIVVMIVS